MAISLFDAGLLGAIAISLASSWAWGEVFGWPHSLNNKVKQAPWFYLVRFLILLIAGTIVLIAWSSACFNHIIRSSNRGNAPARCPRLPGVAPE